MFDALYHNSFSITVQLTTNIAVITAKQDNLNCIKNDLPIKMLPIDVKLTSNISTIISKQSNLIYIKLCLPTKMLSSS